ncbi:hypothetical protein BGX27_007616 [Mortierella sp. AM989]|nr:hypothetical protein BGX27_007616 [Mortierella sp. AM989]
MSLSAINYRYLTDPRRTANGNNDPPANNNPPNVNPPQDPDNNEGGPVNGNNDPLANNNNPNNNIPQDPGNDEGGPAEDDLHGNDDNGNNTSAQMARKVKIWPQMTNNGDYSFGILYGDVVHVFVHAIPADGGNGGNGGSGQANGDNDPDGLQPELNR